MTTCSHHWREIGGEGDRYPGWLRALALVSGAYAIRDASSHRVLYVGSSGGALYSTITRHFQQWKRAKQWWKGMRGAGHDPGLTYARGRCEVSVCVTRRGDHLEAEAELIRVLKPRDNLALHPDGEEAPF